MPSKSPLFAVPSFSFRNSGIHWIPFDMTAITFHLENSIKYRDNLFRDSSMVTLPVYPGLGDYQNFGGTLGKINFTNDLTLDYSAFISAQYGYLFSSKQIIFGSNLLFRFAVTDKLQFLTWGQYVTTGNSPDPTFNMRTFFPKTNIGAGLQYNSSEKAKIKFGVEYQYDQGDKIWKPESGGKVLINF
ncbi:MAG: hypothetical protein AB2L24_33160 [Mangrovibacterium sp.]